jgi:regulator of cell morphogenesis and NO signaling
MTFDALTKLADLAIEDSRRARVLERFGLDYCCDDHRPLSDATVQANLDLQKARRARDIPESSTHKTTTSQESADLAHDIVDTHHV